MQENFSDAKTIQYVEPYRDTSTKDQIYRRKAKKKAIQILTKKRKEISDDEQDHFSDAETIQYAEPYREASTKDEIYNKSEEKSHKNID